MFGAAHVPRWEPTLSYLVILAYAELTHGYDAADFGFYFYQEDWQTFLNFFMNDLLDDPQIQDMSDPNIFDGSGHIDTAYQDRCLNPMPPRELAAIQSLHGSPRFNPENRRRRMPQYYELGLRVPGGRTTSAEPRPATQAGQPEPAQGISTRQSAPAGAVASWPCPALSCGYPATDQQDLNRHLQVCRRLLSLCHNCGAVMHRFQLRTHTCPEQRVLWSRTRLDHARSSVRARENYYMPGLLEVRQLGRTRGVQ